MSDDPKPNYYYELTTDKFRVNSDGYLVVQEVLNKTSTIPDKYTFQVLAREMEKKVATVPLTITVNLNRHDPDVDSLSAATVPPSYLKVVPTRSTPVR